jgi:20S proteasome alpha/beta subunit
MSTGKDLTDIQGYRYDLTDEEAQELGRRSIVAAGHRDAYSGNTVNLFHVRENGWEFISMSLSHVYPSHPI